MDTGQLQAIAAGYYKNHKMRHRNLIVMPMTAVISCDSSVIHFTTAM
jgi:hypothetical protein